MRPERLPQSWNNGIVECWNAGFKKDNVHFNFIVKTNFATNPISQHPLFYSYWGEAPNLNLFGCR